MCGIAGIYNLNNERITSLTPKLIKMGELIAHRGPDDSGIWKNKSQSIGFSHRRLSIIDLSSHGHQPMIGNDGSVIVLNGEIYNYKELFSQLSASWQFQSHSDTESILAAYHRYKTDCVTHLRGMFAFALWDGERLFCARDRFGIKPFYYALVNNQFIFASEVKALLPFLSDIETDAHAFSEYITFQYPIGEKTLFKGIYQLLPAHTLEIYQGKLRISRYWDVSYNIDEEHNAHYFESRLRELLSDSIDKHLVSDVALGCYVSGGIDSSLIALLSCQQLQKSLPMFNGRFSYGEGYDESRYAQEVADQCGAHLHIADIGLHDFVETIQKVIYHLDYPVAGPGAFPQYIVSRLASEHVKVVLGGQGGDEIFGGYARYLIAYFEQCFKAAIEGTYRNGNFVVTAESIIPNLNVLNEYKPLIKQFFSQGLFENLDIRYFNLIDRSADFKDEIDWHVLDKESIKHLFLEIFNSVKNFRAESYFDSMTHFDFKCLLPGLLHVEDRVSMAHGLEARVPFLDHPLIEFMATIPANVKFKDGNMKHLLKHSYSHVIPKSILERRDKMGFPVPLNEWMQKELREFIFDILLTGKNKKRPFVNYQAVINNLEQTSKFSRKLWGFLSYELWYQTFHDQKSSFSIEDEKELEVIN